MLRGLSRGVGGGDLADLAVPVPEARLGTDRASARIVLMSP